MSKASEAADISATKSEVALTSISPCFSRLPIITLSLPRIHENQVLKTNNYD